MSPRKRCIALASGAIALALALASGAGATSVDGVLDGAYGGPLSLQVTQTSLGESPPLFTGSELDAAHAFIVDDTLWLFVAGNFNRFFSEPLVFPNQLQIYIDSKSGGQNPLSNTNTSTGYYLTLQDMAGLEFDPEFVPDFWFGGSREATLTMPFFIHYSELPSSGGGSGYFVGRAGFGGPGTLSDDGSNPYGILASLDVSNTGGVTAGCEASSGSGVTTGVEYAIPLAAIGNPAGPIRICALLAYKSGGGVVSNQILGPVPPGTCSLGPASGVNFGSIAGMQYFVVDPTTPAVRTTWGSVKARYR